MAAKAGMKSLCRHRMSKRSSPIPKRTTDCKESIADKYDASFQSIRSYIIQIHFAKTAYLVVWEFMQDPTSIDLLVFHHKLSITSSRCSRHNVFVEREWNKYNNHKKIDNSANGAHIFRAVYEY